MKNGSDEKRGRNRSSRDTEPDLESLIYRPSYTAGWIDRLLRAVRDKADDARATLNLKVRR